MNKSDKNQELLSPGNIIAGMLIACVLGIAICFFVVGPKNILYGSKAFFWQKHTCSVDGSEFDKEPANTPSLLVKVRYEFDGRQYNATCRLTDDSQQHLQRQSQLFLRPGDKVVCRINPDHPEEIMLDKEYTPFEISLIMSVTITGISFITGLVMLWMTWTRKNRRSARFRFLVRKAVVLIFSGIVVIASGTATIFGLTDAFRMMRTLGWTQSDATIKASDASEVREGELWTYKYNLRYSYNFDGKQYEGNRWSLFDADVSTQRKMREALNLLMPGQVVPCYVNSSSPEQAVLNRRAWSFLGLLLVPLVTLLAAYFFWDALREKQDDSKQTDEDDRDRTDLEGTEKSCQPAYPHLDLNIIPKLPFRLQYELNRRQRFVPHMKIWMPYGPMLLIMLGGTFAGVIEISWWYLPLFLFALWYVFWYAPGFILGLIDVTVWRKRPMDVIVNENAIGILVGEDRLWMSLDGILRIDKLSKDTWTIYHNNGTIISIPAAIITDEQIGFMKYVAERPKG
jgi:hypothetical protein